MTSSPRDHGAVERWPGFTLLDDELTLAAAADDWGHCVRHRPRAVLRPADASAIAAAQRQYPLVPRGQGHSVDGSAQADNGVVVDMSTLDTIHEIHADRAIVDAGVRWSELLRATYGQGHTPPVLTDYLELSVGGTLSVGGIGGATHRYGLQADNVLELEVVTHDGSLVRCSRTERPWLFDSVRAGHGRHGIIVRATLRLVPARPEVYRRKLYYPDLAGFLRDQRKVVAEARFDYLEGQAQLDESGQWYYVLETALFQDSRTPHVEARYRDLGYDSSEAEELPYFDFLNRMAPQETELRRTGEWFHPHPWLNLLLPSSAVPEIVGDTMRRLTVKDIGETGVVLLYPFPTARVGTPGVPLPPEETTFLFALLRTAPPDDPAAVARMLADNERLRRLARSRGGTSYAELAPE